jgi:uncharacterized repeat protein (TIGR03803 family)
MISRKLPIVPLAALSLILGLLTTSATAFAPSKEKILHFFNGSDGRDSYSNLIFDAAGNLYGTTCCTIFKLSPGANGKWSEKVLHAFDGKDGISPYAGLIFDSVGNLYGTTEAGGTNQLGTVFQLSPGANGKWSEKVLHTFRGRDGYAPYAGVISDTTGNLYGTTIYGGTSGGCGGRGCGVVFKLTPGADGRWTERVLHNFNGKDGFWPQGGVILDAAGNLYGTTSVGGKPLGCGAEQCGVVFELETGANDTWTYRVLHTFNEKDGAYPLVSLLLDADGNLYGTTWQGGDQGIGTVFELMPEANSRWTEKVLHSFTDGTDGGYPSASLIFDTAGNLYGTTNWGGSFDCGGRGCGVVFELMPGGNGRWTEKVLHVFSDTDTDGIYPDAGLLLDGSGNLYGTTSWGGKFGGQCSSYGCGMVFEIIH